MVIALLSVAAGVIVVLIASSRDWRPAGMSVTEFGDSSSRTRPFTALALAALAATAALFAARGRWRTVLAGLVVALAVAIFVAPNGIEPRGNSWRLVVMVGGVLIGDGGIRAVRQGRSWPSMSTRYEREARAASRPPTPWEAIDRGEDPTA